MAMKVVFALRVRDEEPTIRRAIEAHDWVDLIIVCDGGSVDNTCAIASEYPNVLLTHFDEWYVRKDKTRRNIEGRQINHTLEVAEENGADWIVFEDCDCIPNSHLRRDMRKYMETTEFNYIFAPRLYIHGKDYYFNGLGLTPMIYAWKAGLHLRTIDTNRHWAFQEPHADYRVNLMPPYFRLHYFDPDEETTQRKLADIRSEVPGFMHPVDFGGEILPIPDEWR